MDETRPNAFLIGVEKSGTTSLARYIAQHPEVFALTHSGARFFAMGEMEITGVGHELHRYVMTPEEHWKLFAGAGDEPVVMESQPTYFPVKRTAGRIRDYCPDAKLILVLRHPAWRAWSHYQFLRREAFEPLDTFAEALEAEEERRRKDWHYRYYYRDNGRYARHLRKWLEHFPRERFCIVRYEELRDRPHDVLRRIFGLLGIDRGFRADTSKRYNVSGEPRNAAARALLRTARPARRWLARRLPHSVVKAVRVGLTRRQEPPMDVLERLTEDFEPDVEELEALLGWDLSGWKPPCRPG